MADSPHAPFEVGDFQHVYDPSLGEAGPWYLNDHTFVRDREGTWHLIGITHAEPFAPFEEVDLAHATAPEVTGPWTKQRHALTADPASGEHHLWAPHVIEHRGRYWMYYCAGGDAPEAYRIHLATSDDCWRWERHPANPIVVDGYEARDPMVLRVGDRWVMYYTATLDPSGGPHIVAACESDDLVHWSGRHVVYQDELSGTGAGPTESPFVVARDDRFLLFLGPDYGELMRILQEEGRYGPAARAAYRRTRVLASSDPLRFRAEDQVATIASHAAEVVHDEHDRWWVSHCGWGEGGAHLAPLTWR
jgi:arabinan endo-1,5-alpha-L-arabinosidase